MSSEPSESQWPQVPSPRQTNPPRRPPDLSGPLPPHPPHPYLPPPLAPGPPMQPPPPPRGEPYLPSAPAGGPVPEGSKSFVATLVLTCLFGMFGADHFYLGKNRSGVLKLCTFGGFGLWWLFDMGLTLFGGQRDQWGLRLAGYDQHKKTAWIVAGAILAAGMGLNILEQIVPSTFENGEPTPLALMIVGGLAAAVAASVSWLGRHRGANAQSVETASKHKAVPPGIQIQLDKLATLRQVYVLHAAAGNRSAGRVVEQLDLLIPNVNELFRRLDGKKNKATRGIAQREYEDKLSKLGAALDRDYLLDILVNPHLWEDPEKRTIGVQEALQTTNAQLLDSIRQINTIKGLEF